MQCSTGQGKTHSPLFRGALQNRLTVGWSHCSHTYGHLLFIQMCSEPTEPHWTTGLGKLHSPLFSAALQNRLTGRLVSLHYTYGHLLFIQICSEPTGLHCSTGLGKLHSRLFCTALQTTSQQACVTAMTPTCICSAGVLSANRTALQHLSGQNAFSTVQCCFSKQANNRLVSLRLHLWAFALRTGVQRANRTALQHWSWQIAFPTVQCCSA